MSGPTLVLDQLRQLREVDLFVRTRHDEKDAVAEAAASKRKEVGAANLPDARQGGEAPQQLVVKLDHLAHRRRVVADGHVDVHEHRMLGAESGVDREQLSKAPREQPGADEEDQRQGDLGDDEPAANPVTPAGARLGALGLSQRLPNVTTPSAIRG